MIKLRAVTADTWEEIKLGDGNGSFWLLFRAPSFNDRVADDAVTINASESRKTLGERIVEGRRARLAALVVGWRDVTNDTGEPVEFSLDRLELLLSQHSDAYWRVLDLLAEYWAGSTPKNSQRPSGDGLPAAGLTTTPPG